MVQEEFVFRGDLATTPLPDMLATIHRHGVPGVLNCASGELTKNVHFDGGDIIFASSSDIEESLGESLLKEGLITEDELRLSSDELRRSPGLRHGTVMVQMGFLEPHQLGSAVRRQVENIVWSLFAWTEGAVTFRVGRFRDDEVYKIQVPTTTAILQGCRHLSDPKEVTARLGGRRSVLQPATRPDHLVGFELEGDEQKLLDLVDGKRSLYELCEIGPMSPGVNARVLYALLTLELIALDQSPGAIKIQVRDR